jgi:cellulose biosynthesis protein BcsQ
MRDIRLHESKLPDKFTNHMSILKDKRGTGVRRLVITVWGQCEFACELAYCAARSSGLDVLLADLDLLSPKVDLFLKTGRRIKKGQDNGVARNSGIDEIFDEAAKGMLDGVHIKKASIRRRELRNLYILTGSSRIENYEYYSDEDLLTFIDKAARTFDLTILSVGKSIYDSFTSISLLKSDCNLIPIHADMADFREFNKYILFLEEKQHLPQDKNMFIAFEYDPRLNLDAWSIKEISANNFFGCIRTSGKRNKCRNLQIPYARKMDVKVYAEYLTILSEFGITGKAVLSGKVY